MAEERREAATEDLGLGLAVLLRAYRERLTPVLEDFPQGPRGYQTLCEVVRADQPSQLVLAHRLGIDRTAMTYVIDDLVDAGMVERLPNPDDRRQRRIVATTRGRRAVAALCDQVAEAERAVLGALDDHERVQFRALLDRAVASEHPAHACEAVDEEARRS